MLFWRQVGLIVWKNTVTRKRNKLRLAVDIIWPLILFIILYCVRTKGLRKLVPNCYLLEKPMPSAGAVPFFQGFFCAEQNTCFDNEQLAKTYLPDINNKTVNQLIHKIRQVISSYNPKTRSKMHQKNMKDLFSIIQNIQKDQKNTKNRKFNLNKLITEPGVFSKFFNNISKNEMDHILNAPIINNSDLFRLIFENDIFYDCSSIKEIDKNINYLCYFDKNQIIQFKKLIDQNWNPIYSKVKVKNYIEKNLNTFFTFDNWIVLNKAVKGAILKENKLFNDEISKDVAEIIGKVFSLMFSFLCGQSVKKENSTNQQGQIEFIQEQLIKISKHNYTYDNYATPQCNALFEKIEANPLLKRYWNIYKPFLCGKIIYYPTTPVTDRLMGRIKDILTSLNEGIRRGMDLLNPANPTQFDWMEQLMNFDTEQMSLNGTRNIRKDPTSNSYDELFKLINKLPGATVMSDITSETFKTFIECLEKDKVVAYNDSEKALNFAMELVNYNRIWAYVEFNLTKDGNLPPLTFYKIRMNPDHLENTEFINYTSENTDGRVKVDNLKYITSGFIYLQDMIDRSIIIEKTNITNIPGIVLNQLPFPCYIDDHFINLISGTFPLYVIIAWILPTAVIVKSIVYEKEMRLKETMKVMGLGNGIHWFGWMIDSLVPMMLTVFLLSIILVYGKIFTYSDLTVIYIFLFIYSFAVIAQAFLISLFFQNANLAAACGGIIHLMLYLPFEFVQSWFLTLSFVGKMCFSVLANVAVGLGTHYFSEYEKIAEGVNWRNVNKSPVFGDKYNLLCTMLMLIIDTIIYLILTWYIEAVWPGDYGIPQPWYFPLSRSYWSAQPPNEAVYHKKQEINDAVEPPAQGLIPGVEIIELSKKYPNGKKAVNNITITFYEGQITSFLGHNGAGKTTTISILTGLIPPSSGTALINGHDIRTDLEKVRKNLGMCPQHNVLFQRLTVREHLWFYGMLRGGKNEELLNEEIEQMLIDLKIPDKRNAFPDDLSGGMQRKLSIAVAFIGGSKTVILDEPTSGVDPYSRRSIWELLIKYKQGRTLILTTHFMDEADLLGDRIAIISNGSIICVGSPAFLKSKYARGYKLTAELSKKYKMPELDPNGEIVITSNSQITEITNFITYLVPNSEIVDQMGRDLIYNLPIKSSSQLAQLCTRLDLEMERLGIQSYGISHATLEEVFLTVATDKEQIDEKKKKNWFFTKRFSLKRTNLSTETNTNDKSPPVVQNDVFEKNTGLKKYAKQFYALHVKRFLHTFRNLKVLAAVMLLPVILISVSLLVLSFAYTPNLNNWRSLELSPWSYDLPIIFFLSADQPGNSIDNMLEELQGPVGLGSTCLLHEKGYCQKPDSKIPPLFDLKPSNVANCSCETGAQICKDGIDDSLVQHMTLASKNELYFVANNDTLNWVLNTWPKYKRRLGGFTLNSKLVNPSLNIGGIFPEKFQKFFHSTVIAIKVWFNNIFFISPVANLNAINNVILRAYSNSQSQGIVTYNHPLKFNKKQLIELERLNEDVRNLFITIIIIFALIIVAASFCLYLIEERISNSKHLQMVSGVNRLVYWLEAFIWDFSIYIVAVIICLLVFYLFGEKWIVSKDNLMASIALMLLFGWACIPLIYLLSYSFEVPSSAFVVLSCFNLLIGVLTTATSTVMGRFTELKSLVNVLEQVFFISPHFCLGNGFLQLSSAYKICEAMINLDYYTSWSPFKWNYIGKNLFFLFLFGVLLFLSTIAIEYRLYRRCIPAAKYDPNTIIPTVKEDDDVAAERLKVQKNPSNDDVLVIRDLVKIYPRKANPSVNRICLSVQKGECFGLLGLNGAGKTTTFKMLTGHVGVTSGDATILGYSVTREIDKARSVLGYCPQFDALDPLLTPYEHLILYGRIRNIPSEHLKQRVNTLITRMALEFYRNSLAGSLSGGNKRKLSTAIALIGNPPLVFLDEPTTGMDPRARRFLWNCIHDIVKSGTCVILTSHSMEECQALCTRLTIMVHGQFKCLGTSQHLKMKYGGGYLVTIRCSKDKLESAKIFMASRLHNPKLVESHYNQIKYEISGVNVSELFNIMEEAKNKKTIDDYSLSQTTLEEVFLKFAREQRGYQESLLPGPAFFKICKSCCKRNDSIIA